LAVAGDLTAGEKSPVKARSSLLCAREYCAGEWDPMSVTVLMKMIFLYFAELYK
jgi:hypothetical protein